MKSRIFPMINLARHGETVWKPANARPFRDYLTAGRFRQRILSSRAQPPGTKQELLFYLPVAWDSESGRSPGTVYASGDPTCNANEVAASC